MNRQEEIPPVGGRVGSNTPFVHALLRHLDEVGFEGAPRVLGFDRRGWEVLTFLHGHVPPDLGRLSEEQPAEAAGLIRRFHDATAGSHLAGDQEVVCHGDLSPCNAVFVEGVPRALIDFDAAARGPRALDLGYTLWMWLDLGPDVRAQGSRMRLMCDAYGLERRSDPVGMVAESVRTTIRRTRIRPEAIRWMKSVAAWLHANREDLEKQAR